MPAEKLFLKNSYQKSCQGIVSGFSPNGGIFFDKTIFYAASGGQPSDYGNIIYNSQKYKVEDVHKHRINETEILVDSPSFSVGDKVIQEIDWGRRYNLMKVHTALHLLSVVIPLPVTGGSISENKGRLDFAMPQPPESKERIQDEINEFIQKDFEVSDEWISDEELHSRIDLIKTMSVKPPMGNGNVRLVRIHNAEDTIDLQPCGGTHVSRTSEIGHIRLGKIENKGRNNRRVNIFVD